MESTDGKKAVSALSANAATPKHRDLYRLLLAGVDLDEAIEMAELAQERAGTGELSGPLLEAAAVSYARVFAKAPVLGPLPGSFAEHADPMIQWIHHQLLGLREKSVSHAALAKHPVVVHLYEHAVALELVSTELKPENLPAVISHLKNLRTRIAREIAPAILDLFPDRRGAHHLLLTAADFPAEGA